MRIALPAIDPLNPSAPIAIPALFIDCIRGNINLTVLFSAANLSLGPDWARQKFLRHRIEDSDWPRVDFVIDKGEVDSSDWHKAAYFEAMILPRERTFDIVEKLMSASEFRVEAFAKYGRKRVMNVLFRPSGLSSAIKPVLEACEAKAN